MTNASVTTMYAVCIEGEPIEAYTDPFEAKHVAEERERLTGFAYTVEPARLVLSTEPIFVPSNEP